MTQSTNSQLRLIRCVTQEGTIKQRLEERGYDRDKEKLRDWRGFMLREPIRVPLPDGGIEIDTSQGLEQCVELALCFLKTGRIA